MGHSFFESLAGPLQKRRDCSPSGSFGNHHGKRTWVNSPEVDVRSEHRSTWSGNCTAEVIPDNRPSSAQQKQGSSNPLSSPTKAIPHDGTAAGSSKSTGNWTSSVSGSSCGNMADSNLDTASGDFLSCSGVHTDCLKEIQKKSKSIQ